MRRGGHRGRTDIAGSKVLSAAITPGRKCTDGFEPSRAVLQTAMITRSCARMDSVRVERTPAVLQTAAATESAYCPDHPHGTRTRISTLRGWLPEPVSRGGDDDSSET